MKITVNGEARQFDPGATVAGLVESMELAGQRIAVEINEELVPRSTFAEHDQRPLRRIG